MSLNTRGRAALLEGDTTRAEAQLREAAALCGRLRDTWAIRFTLMHLADVAALQSDAARAALLYGAADLLTEKNVSAFPVLHKVTERCRPQRRSSSARACSQIFASAAALCH